MKIRIAQQGWHVDHAAVSQEDTSIGVHLLWIELDGHRFEDVISADFGFSRSDFGRAEVTLDIFGPVEIVYCDREGNELPGKVRTEDVGTLSLSGPIEHESSINNPEHDYKGCAEDHFKEIA